eukprot:scaffold275413_cov27-Tisochrysis_lutea.AAC.2
MMNSYPFPEHKPSQLQRRWRTRKASLQASRVEAQCNILLPIVSPDFANPFPIESIAGIATRKWAALETAKKAPPGSVILAMLPDTGERYLSTPLYADIEADMNDEELEIAKSTPSFQLIPGKEPVLAA